MHNLLAAIAILGFWVVTIFVVAIMVLAIVNRVNHDHDTHSHAPTVTFEVTTPTATPTITNTEAAATVITEAPTATPEAPTATPEAPTYGSYTHPLNGGERYTVTLRSPITLIGNPISGEIECANEYGTVTVVGSYDGTRGTHSQDVYGSRGLGYDGIPNSGSTLEITDTLDRCWGWGTWK